MAWAGTAPVRHQASRSSRPRRRPGRDRTGVIRPHRRDRVPRRARRPGAASGWSGIALAAGHGQFRLKEGAPDSPGPTHPPAGRQAAGWGVGEAWGVGGSAGGGRLGGGGGDGLGGRGGGGCWGRCGWGGVGRRSAAGEAGQLGQGSGLRGEYRTDGPAGGQGTPSSHPSSGGEGVPRFHGWRWGGAG